MKKLLVIVSVFISLSLFSQETGIQFEHDLSIEQVAVKAKAANKFVFVDCYTEWCGPCKKLSAEVFPNEEVGAFFNANFINVKIDVEKGEGKHYAKKYNINGFPTLLILDANGEIISIEIGYKSVDQLLAMGKYALKNPEPFSVTVKKVESGDRSPDLMAKYLKVNFSYSEYNKYSSIIDEYFLKLSETERMSEMAWDIFNEFQYNIYSEQYQYFLKNRESFDEKFGAESVTQKILFTFSICFQNTKEGSKEYNDLKNIDSTLFANFLVEQSLYDAYNQFLAQKKNADAWKAFIAQFDGYAQMTDASIANKNYLC